MKKPKKLKWEERDLEFGQVFYDLDFGDSCYLSVCPECEGNKWSFDLTKGDTTVYISKKKFKTVKDAQLAAIEYGIKFCDAQNNFFSNTHAQLCRLFAELKDG